MMRLALAALLLPLAFGAQVSTPKHCAKGTPKDSCRLYLQMAAKAKVDATPRTLGVPLHPSLKVTGKTKTNGYNLLTTISSESVKTLAAWYRKRLPKWKPFHMGSLWYIASRNDESAAMSMGLPEVMVMPCPGGKVAVFACKTEVQIVYPAK